MKAKRIRERGNLIFVNTVNNLGAKFLTLSATRMGINIIRESIRIIPERGIATDCPKSILINAGSVKGIRREVTTTMTMTRGLFAFTRFDINGATTPVEMPERSRAATA